MTDKTLEELSDRELDAIFGLEVMKLDRVGYWRRKSCHTSEWEECQKGEATADEPRWKADIKYYDARYAGPFHLPEYSARMDCALDGLTQVKPGPLDYFSITWMSGSWRADFAELTGMSDNPGGGGAVHHHAGIVDGAVDNVKAMARSVVIARIKLARAVKARTKEGGEGK